MKISKNLRACFLSTCDLKRKGMSDEKIDNYNGPLQIGNISDGGQYVIIKSVRDMAYAEIMKEKLQLKHELGIPLDDELPQRTEEIFREKAEDLTKRFHLMISARGFPEKIKRLFEIKDKKSAERYCKTLHLNGYDISDSRFNADQAGFSHTNKHLEIVPEDLEPTKVQKDAFRNISELGPIQNKDARKYLQKISATFKQRKNINAHLYERGKEWHLFWFTYHDSIPGNIGQEPHWQGGNHVHYTSYLWGLNKENVWKSLESSSYKINGTHVKYTHDEVPQRKKLAGEL